MIGTDGRASTSKAQAVLWTFAIFYALLFLLLWGRSVNCGGANRQRALCVNASHSRDVFNKVVNNPLDPEYYVLLGFPLTAAVAAKALTTSPLLSADEIE